MLFNAYTNSTLLNANIDIGIVYIDVTLSISETRAPLNYIPDKRPTQTHIENLTRDFFLNLSRSMKKASHNMVQFGHNLCCAQTATKLHFQNKWRQEFLRVFEGQRNAVSLLKGVKVMKDKAEITHCILDKVPKEAEVTRIEYEGSMLSVYTKTPEILTEQSSVVAVVTEFSLVDPFIMESSLSNNIVKNVSW